MGYLLLHNPTIVNEGCIYKGDVLIHDENIVRIKQVDDIDSCPDIKSIDCSSLYLLPGIIDTHVHFRDPGLTHKADIFSESCAAVAGGVTSFMDMPNTVPQTTSPEALKDKYMAGSEKSVINYSFYMGATNHNLNDLLNINPVEVCGIKLFLGSSTGDMLVDDKAMITELFKKARLPIVAHCEDEDTIRNNTLKYRQIYGENIPMYLHPALRDRNCCFKSSSFAIDLAKEYGTRLHIAHISTADEIELFASNIPLPQKKITAEACTAHLCFDDSDYVSSGSHLKVNPAVKTCFDRKALINGLIDGKIDSIATDHAPHTLEEKDNTYFKAPSGAPVIQHSLAAMLELWHDKIMPVEKIVEKMCHNPAIIFNIKGRGFIREGYKADLCLVNPDCIQKVDKDHILHKCGWSLFNTGKVFHTKVTTTIVNGHIVYDNGNIDTIHRGERLIFDR